jgi:nucleotide-binding universal stress UspA family protein
MLALYWLLTQDIAIHAIWAIGGRRNMRTYLVVIDESAEARLALRFAARRAAKTGGALHILSLVEQSDFVAWGGVQATMEAEAREKAEELVAAAAGTIFEELGLQPLITVKKGDGGDVVKAMLDEHPEIAALVLGAAAQGMPGPLVAHFTGNNAGALPCPVMIIPGSLGEEALDLLS